MKMKKTDIGVVTVLYVICAVFYVYTVRLKKESQTYPLFCIALLFGLTTLYLVQMIAAARKYGVTKGTDEIFPGFVPVQFFVCLAAVAGYLALMYAVGFYLSTVVFLIGLLLYLRVPVLHTAIVTAVLILLVYFAFGKFLGVKLPVGILFK